MSQVQQHVMDDIDAVIWVILSILMGGVTSDMTDYQFSKQQKLHVLFSVAVFHPA